MESDREIPNCMLVFFYLKIREIFQIAVYYLDRSNKSVCIEEFVYELIITQLKLNSDM